jgi:pyruvate,water dikinase
MTGRSWRQDPRLLQSRIDAAAANPGRARPADRDASAAAARRDAIDQLRAALPALQRPLASRLAAATANQFRALEYGKAAVMMAVDGCRAAAAEVGGHLTSAGVIEAPADAVFLRHDELADPGPDARSTIEKRRAVWEQFAQVSLPTHFIGEPETTARTSSTGTERVERITGSAGSSGVAEGRVRLAADASADIEPDEILVCPFTDPSWTPLMCQAPAVVVDIGGAASHGAVMARELGIPCVIGTETAMHDLRDGDTVRVDGTTGIVEVLSHADR